MFSLSNILSGLRRYRDLCRATSIPDILPPVFPPQKTQGIRHVRNQCMIVTITCTTLEFFLIDAKTLGDSARGDGSFWADWPLEVVLDSLGTTALFFAP